MSVKPLLALLAASSVLFLSACQPATDGNLYGYDFSGARITYKISGSSEGKSDVLIKGEKKYIHNQSVQKKANGETSEVDNIIILDGSKLYSLDPKTKTGSMITQPYYSDLIKLTPEERKQKMLTDAINDNRTPEEQQKNPLLPTGTEVVAGQKCDTYKSGNIETCLWQAIPLRTVVSMPDYGIETTTLATNIDLSQTIADSEFAVPSDYKITELN